MDEFFDGQPPSTLLDQFAMYSYALKAMFDISFSTESTLVSIEDIMLMLPGLIVACGEGIRKALEESSEMNENGQQLAKVDLERGVRFSERSKTRRQQSVVKVGVNRV